MTLTMSALRSVATGLDHPEGIALGPDGMLYAGGELGQVYRIDPVDGCVEQIADTEGWVGGVCVDGEGTVYVCNADLRAVLRVDPASGRSEPWCESAGGRPLVLPNWAAFEDDGSMILSDSGSEEVADGSLVRVPPGGGEGERLDVRPLYFPNGLAVGAGGEVYLVESFDPKLSVLRDGRLEDVCALPGVVPDGVAVDVAGDVLVSCYYPFRIVQVTPGPEAQPRLVIEDPLGTRMIMPTNVCYYGEDRRQLAIAALGGSDITAIDLPVAGLPLRYPTN